MFDPIALILFIVVCCATLGLGLWIWCRQEKKRDLRGLQWASAVAVQVQPVSETRRARVVPPLAFKREPDVIHYEPVCVDSLVAEARLVSETKPYADPTALEFERSDWPPLSEILK